MRKRPGLAAAVIGCAGNMASWIRKGKGWLDRYASPARPEQQTEPPPAVETAEEPVYGVIFHALKCPRCQSKDIKTYATRPPTRYHKCVKCKCLFRSTEED